MDLDHSRLLKSKPTTKPTILNENLNVVEFVDILIQNRLLQIFTKLKKNVDLTTSFGNSVNQIFTDFY